VDGYPVVQNTEDLAVLNGPALGKGGLPFVPKLWCFVILRQREINRGH
jgi:hypothetical protein